MKKHLKLLIIEDSENDAILLLRELRKGGYDIEHKRVEVPSDMKKSLDEESWDAIISDYYMPNFTALDALNILKEKDPDLPFIIVSGAIGEETAVKAMREGANDYIMKNELTRLIPAIEREIKETKIRRENKRAEEELKLNETRLYALHKLNQMTESSKEDMSKFVLQEAIKLTRSEAGFIGFLKKNEQCFDLGLWTDSKTNVYDAFNENDNKAINFSGIINKSLKERKPIVINERNDLENIKKGKLFKDIKINRVLSVPIFRNNIIVTIVIVINKEKSYNDIDVKQLQLLMDGMCWTIKRRETEDTLKNSLQEKKILLQEIHHRVKNNLQIISSLLNLQSRNIKDEHYYTIFKESQNRIKSMALIHDMLYQSDNLAQINFYQYIKKIIRNLYSSYATENRPVEMNIQIDNVHLNVDEAIPCGLIVNELISNSLKYAFPEDKNDNKIEIALYNGSNNNYTLVISDNGIGIPDKYFRNNQSRSLGLQLVKALVKQINGNIELDNTDGTSFKINFET
ncbi:MAG: histidine kinase dimerization/phosphoacceptor domain -containing protein, partial [Spirochaetota bacterium]